MKTLSTEETQNLAKDLAQKIKKPTLLTLKGELGAGKTTFIQSFAQNLGIEKRILSPTFVFIRSYPIEKNESKVFHHVDLYRCSDLKDAKSIGIEEILSDPNAIVAIEWPEVISDLLPENRVKIEFKKTGENEREITIS